MREIPDNDFDRIFKEKSQSFDFNFEEEAWLLMEKKLRKRDRFVFFRNTSVVLLLLTLLGTGFYLLAEKQTHTITQKSNKLKSEKNSLSNPEIKKFTGYAETRKKPPEAKVSVSNKPSEVLFNIAGQEATKTEKGILNKRNLFSATTAEPTIDTIRSEADLYPVSLISLAAPKAPSGDLNIKEITEGRLSNLSESKKSPVKIKKHPNYSFTFSAGPDFSSTESIAGKKGSLQLGLLVNASIKRFTISTGARYGVKEYSANGLDYSLRNPARANLISTIDAACNVLEVPLQFSYALFSNNKRKIEFNSSLSSYILLKEKYLFCYKPESGIKDYLLQKNNANRSFFGVASLSASYKFKPIRNNIQLGIEPYVKLPLGGLGEGKVRLKSSGISLNMTYDISKKH